MTLADLSPAAPPCHECDEPVQRLELSWYWDVDQWRSRAYLICAAGCRVPVEPFD